MTDPTPTGMLNLYRSRIPEADKKQVNMFLAMGAPEKMELLFYMIMNCNMTIHHLSNMVNGGVQEISEPPKV